MKRAGFAQRIRDLLRGRSERTVAADIQAVDRLLICLERSSASPHAAATVAELVARVESAKEKLRAGDGSGYDELRVLCAPTGSLQETSIDNG